jgi:hypothetical protein
MRPWTAEDVEKWGAGYIANQMNGFVQNISALRAEVERLRDAMTCACEVMAPEFAAHEVLTAAIAGKGPH